MHDCVTWRHLLNFVTVSIRSVLILQQMLLCLPSTECHLKHVQLCVQCFCCVSHLVAAVDSTTDINWCDGSLRIST
jgi:hypothetical protein